MNLNRDIKSFRTSAQQQLKAMKPPGKRVVDVAGQETIEVGQAKSEEMTLRGFLPQVLLSVFDKEIIFNECVIFILFFFLEQFN